MEECWTDIRYLHDIYQKFIGGTYAFISTNGLWGLARRRKHVKYDSLSVHVTYFRHTLSMSGQPELSFCYVRRC